MVEPVVPDRSPTTAPSERMQRLRVGITGLAAVLLLVIVATAIASGARRMVDVTNTGTSAGQARGSPASNVGDPETEPLAQLGAAPGTKSEGESAPRE